MGGFDSLVGRLEEKYGGPKSRGKKRATPMDTEPTEDEFLATQKKLFTGKKNPRSSKKVVQEHDEDEDIDLGSDEEEEVTPPPKPAKRGRATNTRNRTKAKA
jgi:DnaJ family protein C protein 9